MHKVVILVEMTFQQYIDNPMGKKAAVFSQRDMYKDLYTKKYGAVLLRENGTFTTEMYYDKKKERYFIYMKVPSEVVEKFYYDVVVEFYPIDATNATDGTLNNYGVRFFSNDPAFVFTYEYVFNKNELFITELKSKASKIALKRRPEERNPYEIPGYVKSLYFCFLHMKSRSLFNKTHWKNYSKPFVLKTLLDKIEMSDKKVADRQRLGEEVRKKKATEARKKRNEDTANRQQRQHTVKTQSGVNVIKPKSPITGKTSIGNVNKPKGIKTIKKK